MLFLAYSCKVHDNISRQNFVLLSPMENISFWKQKKKYVDDVVIQINYVHR
jgi:FMN-dependent NADH-azoreductase